MPWMAFGSSVILRLFCNTSQEKVPLLFFKVPFDLQWYKQKYIAKILLRQARHFSFSLRRPSADFMHMYLFSRGASLTAEMIGPVL